MGRIVWPKRPGTSRGRRRPGPRVKAEGVQVTYRRLSAAARPPAPGAPAPCEPAHRLPGQDGTPRSREGDSLFISRAHCADWATQRSPLTMTEGPKLGPAACKLSPEPPAGPPAPTCAPLEGRSRGWEPRRPPRGPGPGCQGKPRHGRIHLSDLSVKCEESCVSIIELGEISCEVHGWFLREPA